VNALTGFSIHCLPLDSDSFVAPIVPESEDLGEEVRKIMFRTKAGRTFRALFVVVATDVAVVRVVACKFD
jgi:hypothetical protein